MFKASFIVLLIASFSSVLLSCAQLVVPNSSIPSSLAAKDDCPCYKSTTTVVNPTCTPWAGICPAIICVTPTATVTKTIPGNANALTRCRDKNVPTVTAYSPCTTDCAPITCPTATATVVGKEKQCCTAW
ncbi:hypothetical protein AC578_4777 [Pseudocercospora eumusae]|uniref:Uncharacterized protein n=1 Tax=Pseudocercospora eumusae TaxID=321146 RepID=A0A139HLC8_9PEZI|nr:hypothetical protein AC578_4777 [Pseudocercospora eumusae]